MKDREDEGQVIRDEVQKGELGDCGNDWSFLEWIPHIHKYNLKFSKTSQLYL